MSPAAPRVRIRPSTDDDAAAIAAIYGPWVERGLGSFELAVPTVQEMAARRRAVLDSGFPYLVAVDDSGAVLGYAYASWFRTRAAYRFSCEDSVYVSPAAVGRGVGRRLLDALVQQCKAMDLRLMVAVIGDSGNAASIALHRAAGFSMAGTLPAIGWKHAQWVDVVLMTLPLGDGAATPPVEHGRLLDGGRS